MYKILRSFLFLFDAEKVHYFSMNGLKFLCKIPFVKGLIAKKYTPSSVTGKSFKIFNLEFKNLVGLGAGFDKNARYLNELEALGFGFIEIGTVTPMGQTGNDLPRLFRLPKDKALINRMGFNNDGLDVIVERLKQWNKKNTSNPNRLIIGGNIGKNKVTPNEDAWKDYEICFTALYDYVDYFVVNVSSPNTPGLRELQGKDSLAKILQNLQRLNKLKDKPKAILLKIAPDLTIGQIDDVVNLALEIKLDGLVVANTTIDKSKLVTKARTLQKIGAGGLSGRPLQQQSTDMIGYIANKTNRKILIIASGGIFTAADAKQKIDAGASLVQVWTGFIYEGPAIVKNITKSF